MEMFKIKIKQYMNGKKKLLEKRDSGEQKTKQTKPWLILY